MPVTIAIPEVVQKFNDVLDFQDGKLVERRKALVVCQTSLVARLHTMLYGNPGNAKSMTVDGLLRHFPELRLFKTQAYKASTPEQFLGPISLRAMEEDRYERITTGKFADCEVAYIDETPRAPRAVLPAFQGGMVEREFDNGGGPQPIPLMSFFGTANHLPDDEELHAFFDRYTFKLTIEPPQSQAAFIRILRGGIERRAARGTNGDVPPELLISRDELVALQEHATTIEVPNPILEALAELWSNLLALGVVPSIRRQDDLVGGMQAYAALNGRDEVVQDDIMLAADSLWTSPEEAEPTYSETVKFASEWEREKSDLLDGWSEQHDRLTKLQSEVAQVQNPSKDMTNLGLEILQQNSSLRPLVEKHIASAAGRDAVPLQRVIDEMERAKEYVQERLLGGLEF